jgi:hypothetical protein
MLQKICGYITLMHTHTNGITKKHSGKQMYHKHRKEQTVSKNFEILSCKHLQKLRKPKSVGAA